MTGITITGIGSMEDYSRNSAQEPVETLKADW